MTVRGAIGLKRIVRAGVLAAVVLSCGSQPALAEGWQVYSFPDSGFAVQLTEPLAASQGQFRTVGGLVVPAAIFSAKRGEGVFSVTVADLSKTSIEKDAALEAAVKAWGETGEIKVDVVERIDREFGRQLSVLNRDGGRSIVSIFYVNKRLYTLEARTAAGAPTSDATHFQQSLELIGLGAEAFRPENRLQGEGPGRGGPGGPGGPRGPGGRRMPPPEAFEACKGKTAGAAVSFTTPRGPVEAICAQMPGGLAARPERPPPG